MTNATDVLVVGAGPTGLTLALDLARRGISCRIIEKSQEFFNGSRRKGVAPRTLEAFDDLGIIDEIQTYAEPNPPFKLFNQSKPTGVLYFQGGDGKGNAQARREKDADVPYPVMVVLPQWRTEAILRHHLDRHGVTVELGKEFVELEQHPDHVTATVQTTAGEQELITARYLVGADGGRSMVRHALNLPFEGTTSREQTYLIADLEIDGLDHRYRYGWANSDTHGFAQACPMKDSSIWQFGVNVIGDDESVPPEPSLELFRSRFEKITGSSEYRFHDPIWMSKWVFHARMVSDYRSGRAFLAGDAAHAHSPVTGEGLNAGVQDAYNLGWKLALVIQGGADDKLLDTYSEERVPVARQVLSSATSGHAALFSTKPITKIIRQAIVLPALRLPAINRKVMRKLSGLDVNYRESSLSIEPTSGSSRRVRAGDRAPDGWLTDPQSREPIRLLDVLRGPQFVVIGFGDLSRGFAEAVDRRFGPTVRFCQIVDSINVVRSDARVFVDRNRRVARVYGIKAPTIVVVRPDGYVGYRGSLHDEGLWSYLSRFVTDARTDAQGVPTVG